MRISNIDSYVGGSGTDVLDLIRGDQRNVSVVHTEDNISVDITNYTITAVAEFYDASVTVTEARGSSTATITSWASSQPALADRTLTVTQTLPLGGQYSILLPADMVPAANDTPIDAATDVTIAVIYTTVQAGTDANTVNIYKNKFAVIYRHSA